MMRLWRSCAMASVWLWATIVAAQAGSLQVMPVLLDVTSPGAATSTTLRNPGDRPLNVQARVFRWVQENGQERLEPTDAVVVSPPMVRLGPKQDYLLRVVRARRTPVQGQENYRLVIDELPAAPGRSGTVAVVVRHVVPLFFHASGLGPAKVEWSLSRGRRGLWLEGRNSGDRHARVSAVSIDDKGGKPVSLGAGLLGYVLPGATMRWPVRIADKRLSGATVVVRGQSQTGPFSVPAPVRAEH